MMTTHEAHYCRALEIVNEYQHRESLPTFVEPEDCTSEVFLALTRLHDHAAEVGKTVSRGLEWLRGRDTIRKLVARESTRLGREVSRDDDGEGDEAEP